MCAVLEFIGVQFDGPISSITDNKATYDIVRNPGATRRTAHFDRWVHFARQLYLRGALKIFLTDTHNMMADGLTKVTDKTTFFRGRRYAMNITEVHE